MWGRLCEISEILYAKHSSVGPLEPDHFSLEVIVEWPLEWNVNCHYSMSKPEEFNVQRMQKVNRERLTINFCFSWSKSKEQEKDCTALVQSTQLTIALGC